jgi:hypothetical protein
MLQRAKDIKNYTVHAVDGDVGGVEGFYFDDESWSVRYLVAKAGGLLLNRMVLIAPGFLEGADPGARILHTNLTKEQVKNSPGIEADRPVAAQQELDYYAYYGATPYWGSGWEAAVPPGAPASPAPYPGLPETAQAYGRERPSIEERGDPHLRSTEKITDYRIAAIDGEIGHVEDFIIDDEEWAIRYVTVDTRNWLPGKKVLVSPRWISGISWAVREVQVYLSKDEIKTAPEWDPNTLVDREYEMNLHTHYGRTPYWVHE